MACDSQNKGKGWSMTQNKTGYTLLRRVGISVLILLSVAACGGGGGEGNGPVVPPPVGGTPTPTPIPTATPTATPTPTGAPTATPSPTPTKDPVDSPVASSRAEAARFLTQASFGATEESITQLLKPQAQGGFEGNYAKWIDAQLAKAPSQPEFSGDHDLFGLFWRHAVFGDDQLRQRMAFALSQIFVTSAERDFFPEAWRYHASASYYNMLTRNAFGNYRTVLEEVTLHPYMGLYLGTLKNQKESADGSIIPDQNYAREVMQLFSIGLQQLHADGSVKRDTAGQPLPTYNNQDIAGLSRVFTGWSWDSGSFGGDCGITQDCNRKPIKSFAAFHSTLEKQFLGKTIAPGTNATDSLKQALDHIAAHPNVAPFIARRLIQQFVTSNPSGPYVGRVAAVFTSSGGNFGQVIKALLLDKEARDTAYANSVEGFGKLREPVIRLANWMRAFELTRGNGATLQKLPGEFVMASKRDELCQYPMSSPSVFNFWRPGYVPNKVFGEKGLVAPEMQVVHEVCTANYLNMMAAVISGTKDAGSSNGILQFGLTDGNGNIVLKSSYAKELQLDAAALATRMNELLAAGRMPQELQDKIKAAVESVPATSDANRLRRARIAVFLTMAAPEYLVQK
jgi:uncharacterized protein (DUF1800 family)